MSLETEVRPTHTLPAETMEGALGFPGGRTVTTARRTAMLAAVRLINY